MTDGWTIECCNKRFSAKRYRIKPFYLNVFKEEYKEAKCPVCGANIIEYDRYNLTTDNKTSHRHQRVKGNSARVYKLLFTSTPIEIFNQHIKQGSASNSNWYYGKNNSIKNFNDETIGKI